MSRKTNTLIAAGLAAASFGASKNPEINHMAHKVAGAAQYELVDANRWRHEQPSQKEEQRRTHNEVGRQERLLKGAQSVTRLVLKLPKGLRRTQGEGDQAYIQATLPHKKGAPVYFVNIDAPTGGNGEVDAEAVQNVAITKKMPNGKKTSVEIGNVHVNFDPATYQLWEGHEQVAGPNGETISEYSSVYTDYESYGANNNSGALGTIRANHAAKQNYMSAFDLSQEAAALASEAVASVPHGRGNQAH
jgi:hypothetical protein